MYASTVSGVLGVECGLGNLRERHLVLEEGGILRPDPKELALLSFYANAIAHLLDGSRKPVDQASIPTPAPIQAAVQ